MNVSLKDQLSAMERKKYPFVRRDGGVRAVILKDMRLPCDFEEGNLLIATVPVGQKTREPRFGADVPRAYDLPHEATIRVVSAEYFDNNYWEGVN
jgi:hypothetical protein